MGLTRGSKFANVERFVTEREGPRAFRQVVAALAPREACTLSAIDPSAWYDLGLHAALTRAACAHFGGASFARELGRFEVDHELRRPLLWLLKVVPSFVAIRNLNVYWRRAQDSGRWAVVVRPSLVGAALSGWEVCEPLLCERVLGYLGRVLELVGFDVQHLEHPACRAHGHEVCWFEASCTRANAASRRPPRLGRTDLPALILELASCQDRELVEAAILEVFKEQLGFSRVALWLGDGGELRLVRAVGEGQGEVSRRFVLQNRGCVIGRIDLVSTAHVAERAAPLIADLLPGLSVALDSLRPAPPRRDDASEMSAARRARALREAFGLTERQEEVLTCVAEGRTNKEIARDLGCTESAVEQQVTHILRRTGAPNRATLLRRFWSEG